MNEFLPHVDHLVYATPDLQRGIAEIERLTGVRATPGGRHPDLGTHNALLALGPASYLEIIAPDRTQPRPARPRPFGLDTLQASRLVTWAARCSDVQRIEHEAAACGVELGETLHGERQRPDGTVLSWCFTNPHTGREGGLIPFFIDWGQTPHPARSAVGGVELLDLHAEHPEPERIRSVLQQLGLEMVVRRGSEPCLLARLASPRGIVELR